MPKDNASAKTEIDRARNRSQKLSDLADGLEDGSITEKKASAEMKKIGQGCINSAARLKVVDPDEGDDEE